MFQRLKRAWELSARPDRDVLIADKTLMTPEQARKLGEVTGKVILLVDDVNKVKSLKELKQPDEPAEFFGGGTEEEFREMENEDKGLKGVFGLGKD